MDRNTIETALDAGRIRAKTAQGRYWLVRRNGKTKTWKTRPGEFHIPIKIGFRTFGFINQSNMGSDELVILDA